MIISIVIILILLSYSIFPTYFMKIYWKAKNKLSSKEIILTFDDGPSKIYTSKILDILNKNNIRAYFFVVSKFAKDNPQIIKRMLDEGHLIGLHSANHKNAIYRGRNFIKNDFETSISDMQNLGVDIKLYRPPWGHFNLFTFYYMKKHNLKPMLWNVMGEDWKCDHKEIFKRLKKRVKNGAIICLHDGRGNNLAPQNTILALEEFIPYLKKRGYKFKI